MISKLLLFPFLLSIFPILVLYYENIDEIPIMDLILPILLTLLSTIGLFFAFRYFVKSDIKAGLIITLFSVVFFSYGYFFEIFNNTILYYLDLVHQRYILPLFIILTISISFLIIKFKKDLESLRSIFNVISIVMILFISINIISFYIQNESENSISNLFFDEKIIIQNNLPDIYHIVFDEYTSSNVLLNDLHFDNSSIINYLKNSNFSILENALSNYPATEPFLSSTLNLVYLDDKSLEKYDRLDTELKINDNFVMKFLKQNGYKIVIPYSGYGTPDRFLESNQNICSDTVFLKNRFATELSRTTIINYFVEKIIEDERRYVQECTFLNLPTISNEFEQPVYVFAHIMMPHAPYLFDKDGNHVSPKSNKLKGLQGYDDLNGYLNELQFANKQIKDIVSQILKKSNNAIIIIQGDTGTSILNNPDVDDFKKKRLSILFAIHLPENYSIPQNLSPVNTYRIIFNHNFDSNYELLENRYFWYSEFEENHSDITHRFIEITNSLEN